MALGVNGQPVCYVQRLPYLGSWISSSGKSDYDIDRRVAAAWRRFGALKTRLQDKQVDRLSRIRFLERELSVRCCFAVLVCGLSARRV